MFWAAFGLRIKTDLVIMKGDDNSRRGGVTARVYKQVLEQHLPHILGFGAIFMHDNAPIHRAHIIRDWLHSKGIYVMVWPPYSPNLNLIENLWALLKAQMYCTYPELTVMNNNEESLQLLIRAAIATWDDFGDEILTKLLDSMTRRVTAVLMANGWYTKY